MSGGSGIPQSTRTISIADVLALGLVPITIRCTGFDPGGIPRMEIDCGPMGQTAPIAFDDLTPEQSAALFGNSADLSKP